MTDARIGRLLAACLHQAVTDVLPERLDFYEVWLRSQGLRDGSIGLAPISAVLGFLRTEESYDDVMARAGRMAAEWTISAMSPLRRRAIGALPRRWRARAGLRVAAGIVRHVSSASRASTRLRRENGRLDIQASLFCTVREPRKVALCQFYAAATSATLAAFGVPAEARIDSCHAMDGGSCLIAIDLSRADAGSNPAIAA